MKGREKISCHWGVFAFYACEQERSEFRPAEIALLTRYPLVLIWFIAPAQFFSERYRWYCLYLSIGKCEDSREITHMTVPAYPEGHTSSETFEKDITRQLVSLRRPIIKQSSSNGSDKGIGRELTRIYIQ